jgi:sirohydrochlorin ferrochelatase
VSRAILLVDHGSRLPAANQQLEEVARRVKARDPELIVRVAHLEIAEPNLSDGIAACVADGATEVVVHPFFLAPGRHTTRDIPRQVEAAAREHPQVTIHVTAPLGAHDKLVDVILERVAEAGVRS